MVLEVHPKVVPWEIEIEICVVLRLHMWCKDICNWTLIPAFYFSTVVGPLTQYVITSWILRI